MSQLEGIKLAVSSPGSTKLKWRDVCEENAKLVAERLFTNLFIEHTITIPPDLTLSSIIEQFYQVLREKLKELIQNKISDWEIRYPSLLLTTSKLLNDQDKDKIEKHLSDSLPAVTLTHNSSKQSFLASVTNNDGEVSSLIGKLFLILIRNEIQKKLI